jgi:hypothetical protein
MDFYGLTTEKQKNRSLKIEYAVSRIRSGCVPEKESERGGAP